jgi:cobalt-zinc-cadmium efflux system protein
MLTDVAALGLSFFAIRVATRRDSRKTYGFYRVEILVALLNGVFLILIALYIFYEAYHRFLNPRGACELMLLVAAVGLVANLVSAWLLFGKHHGNLNIRGAFFHVLSDAIGSVGAVIASLAILYGVIGAPIQSSALSSAS